MKISRSRSKLTYEKAGYFIAGALFGAVLIGLITIWSIAPTIVRVILIVCLIGILALPWLPEIDLRKEKIQQEGGD